MANKIDEMKNMRRNGYTLQAIGDKFGCSRQYVEQVTRDLKGKRGVRKVVNPEKIQYPELVKWMNKTNNNVRSLAEMVETSEATFRKKLNGSLALTEFEEKKIFEITGVEV